MTADELHIEPGAIWHVEHPGLCTITINGTTFDAINIGDEGPQRILLKLTQTGEIVVVDRTWTIVQRAYGSTSSHATDALTAQHHAELAREMQLLATVAEHELEFMTEWGRPTNHLKPKDCPACKLRNAAIDELARDCIDLPGITTTPTPHCEKHR